MSKPKPGQAVLDAIMVSLVEAESYFEYFNRQKNGNRNLDEVNRWRQAISELKSWRAAFKKMAGARVHGPYDEGWAYMDDDISLAKAILKARAVEARRDKATKSDIAKQTEGGIK
jgi:hypothetical protein